MKLLTKLTLFITGSKMLIVVLFVLLLPLMVAQVSFQYSNYYLTKQQKKVEGVLAKNGIQYYLNQSQILPAQVQGRCYPTCGGR